MTKPMTDERWKEIQGLLKAGTATMVEFVDTVNYANRLREENEQMHKVCTDAEKEVFKDNERARELLVDWHNAATPKDFPLAKTRAFLDGERDRTIKARIEYVGRSKPIPVYEDE